MLVHAWDTGAHPWDTGACPCSLIFITQKGVLMQLESSFLLKGCDYQKVNDIIIIRLLTKRHKHVHAFIFICIFYYVSFLHIRITR